MDKGLKILYATYWSSKGWKDGTISKEDFKIAKNEGYMFEYPNYETHNEALKRLEIVLSKVNSKDVANAFLYSLSTRKLEYRSILGSYYYAKAIPKHKLKTDTVSTHCYFCGWNAWKQKPNEYDLKRGLNVLNFERYKFGGVRHTYLDYALFDLEQFLKLPKVIPSKEDMYILRKILECTNKIAIDSKVSKLRDIILKEKIFKSNKNEISVVLDILGITGILSSKHFPSYENNFVDEYERAPIEHKSDFEYPINRWRASDGINYEKIKEIFGLLIE